MEAYQPPSAQSQTAAPPYVFRQRASLRTVLGVGLLGFALLALGGAGLQFWLLSLFHTPESPARFASITHYVRALEFQQGLFRIWTWGCYLSFAVFLYHASRKAKALAQALRQDGSTGMRYTPAWTVAWFFIPVAFWFKPYSAVKELWLVSGLHRDISTPWYFPLWWAAWILAPILRAISSKLAEANPRVVAFTSEVLFNAATELMLIALAVLAWRVVNSIYKRQQASEQELGLSPSKAAS